MDGALAWPKWGLSDRHYKSSLRNCTQESWERENGISISLFIPVGGEELLEHEINVGTLHENPVNETCNLKLDG